MITYIVAGGETRPFLFNYSALKKFCKDTGKKLSDFNTGNLDFDDIEMMMFRGFESGARGDNKKFTVSKKAMEVWLNQDFGLIETVSQAVANSFDKPKKNPPKRDSLPPIKKK